MKLDGIIHKTNLRKERQQNAIVETEEYLAAMVKLPHASPHTLAAIRRTLQRQRDALARTIAELTNLAELNRDPAEITIGDEVPGNPGAPGKPRRR